MTRGSTGRHRVFAGLVDNRFAIVAKVQTRMLYLCYHSFTTREDDK